MHEHHGLAGYAVWLPVAEAEQLGVRFGGEEPRLGRYSGKKRSARPTAREYGHDVRIAEQGCRCKLSQVK
jgi:hypothetical protein